MPFWPLCCQSEAILSKSFIPVTQAGVIIWENFHPRYQDLSHKNRDPGNQASPASHMNTSKFYEGKWWGEISETEPAWLTGLLWRGPKTLLLAGQYSALKQIFQAITKKNLLFFVIYVVVANLNQRGCLDIFFCSCRMITTLWCFTV